MSECVEVEHLAEKEAKKEVESPPSSQPAGVASSLVSSCSQPWHVAMVCVSVVVVSVVCEWVVSLSHLDALQSDYRLS